nr:MAG TPA: hypothetical protein [Bacteriophage sp.]
MRLGCSGAGWVLGTDTALNNSELRRGVPRWASSFLCFCAVGEGRGCKSI